MSSQTRSDRALINIAPQLRTTDVRSSIEYRELEKKNKKLTTQNNSLKQALKKMKAERNTFNKTHISELIIINMDVIIPIHLR